MQFMSHLKYTFDFEDIGFGSGVQNEGIIAKRESNSSNQHLVPILVFVYLPFALFIVGYIDLDLKVVIDGIVVKTGIIDKVAFLVETI